MDFLHILRNVARSVARPRCYDWSRRGVVASIAAFALPTLSAALIATRGRVAVGAAWAGLGFAVSVLLLAYAAHVRPDRSVALRGARLSRTGSGDTLVVVIGGFASLSPAFAPPIPPLIGCEVVRVFMEGGLFWPTPSRLEDTARALREWVARNRRGRSLIVYAHSKGALIALALGDIAHRVNLVNPAFRLRPAARVLRQISAEIGDIARTGDDLSVAQLLPQIRIFETPFDLVVGPHPTAARCTVGRPFDHVAHWADPTSALWTGAAGLVAEVRRRHAFAVRALPGRLGVATTPVPAQPPIGAPPFPTRALVDLVESGT